MLREEDFNADYVLEAAKAMCVAARTAPKARGTDNLVIRLCQKEDIEAISFQLERDFAKRGEAFLQRDSQNVLCACAIVLIGSKTAVLGLNCGWCGFASCEEKVNKAPLAPCFFNSNDMGLAVGSACSVAMDRRVDSRVMFSAGRAAQELGFTSDCNQTLAIVLSATKKNTFFDRG